MPVTAYWSQGPRDAAANTGGGYLSQDGTLGDWRTETADDFDWSGSVDGFWPVSRLRQGYL